MSIFLSSGIRRSSRKRKPVAVKIVGRELFSSEPGARVRLLATSFCWAEDACVADVVYMCDCDHGCTVDRKIHVQVLTFACAFPIDGDTQASSFASLHSSSTKKMVRSPSRVRVGSTVDSIPMPKNGKSIYERKTEPCSPLKAAKDIYCMEVKSQRTVTIINRYANTWKIDRTLLEYSPQPQVCCTTFFCETRMHQ